MKKINYTKTNITELEPVACEFEIANPAKYRSVKIKSNTDSKKSFTVMSLIKLTAVVLAVVVLQACLK